MAPTHHTTSLQLNLSDLGVVMPFTFFQNSHRHIVRILDGETYPLIADIGPVSTILDIGANVGAATVMLAARYPRASIHSFEPGPDAGALLARNVAALANVRIHPFGLADHDEQCKLYRSTWDPMSASVLASAENTAAFDVVHLRRASDAIGEIGIASAEILKIDTEGCELPVLTNLGSLVANARVIYLEYHSEVDRREIDSLFGPTHVLAHAAARQPHRGDVCYVHRDTEYARTAATLAINR